MSSKKSKQFTDKVVEIINLFKSNQNKHLKTDLV